MATDTRRYNYRAFRSETHLDRSRRVARSLRRGIPCDCTGRRATVCRGVLRLGGHQAEEVAPNNADFFAQADAQARDMSQMLASNSRMPGPRPRGYVRIDQGIFCGARWAGTCSRRSGTCRRTPRGSPAARGAERLRLGRKSPPWSTPYGPTWKALRRWTPQPVRVTAERMMTGSSRGITGAA